MDLLQCAYNPLDAMEVYRKYFGKPDIVIDSGSCGLLNDSYGLGDVFIIGKTMCEGRDVLDFDEPPACSSDIPRLRLMEISFALADRTIRDKMATEADLCGMESYRICQRAKEWGCLCYGFRVGTDRADQNATKDFKLHFSDACRSLYRFLNRFLKNLSD